jgi:4-amino-4-deoxy-L-arabinose transferase-like glycosyltransferase
MVGGIAVASLGARLLLAQRVDVFQDEALYWWWAQDAGVSFSPQPPGIALLVRWGEAVLGPGTLGIRAGSLLTGTLSIVMGAVLAAEFFGRPAAVWAAAFLAACPLTAAVGTVSSPDAPVVFLWLLFIWVTWRAAQTDRWGWWLASGGVLALGGYTKYMMALAVPCAALAVLSCARTRRRLLRPGPWVAMLVAAVAFGSVFVAWNAQRGWPTLRYHLGARHEYEFKLSSCMFYAVAHLGALSPVLCVGVFVAFVWLWRHRGRMGGPAAWLLCFGLVPILFFLPPSVLTQRRLVRVHWDLIGYVAGMVALAGFISTRGARRVGAAAVGTALVITMPCFAAALWPGLAPAVGRRPPTRRMLGWKALADRVRAIEQEPWDTPRFILTGSFDTALCLGVQRRSREDIYTIRHSHDRRYGLRYQLMEWGVDEETALVEQFGHDALFIHDFRHPDAPRAEDQPRRIWRYFEALEPLDEVTVEFGGTVYRRFGLYRARRMLVPPYDWRPCPVCHDAHVERDDAP